jgi:urease accessory protein
MMTDRLDLALAIWLSPAFPVGAYAYSHGLEWAVECGDLRGAESLRGWIADLLECGSLRADTLLFAEAFRASAQGDAIALARVNELALALCGAAERRLETASQGLAFWRAATAAWPDQRLDVLRCVAPDEIAYPVAVAVAAARFAAEQDALARAARAYVLGLVANLVSAAARLGLIGQTDGQKTLAALFDSIVALGDFVAGAGIADLGSCAFASDIAAMRHETQYSRLFRS